MDTTGYSETRAAERARHVGLTLADCAHMAQYIANACADGVKHADEAGADPRFLRDANEIKARLAALVDFVDAGRSYLEWDASQGMPNKQTASWRSATSIAT